MRVSIIGPAYPLRGGIAHHVFWLRKTLMARGHSVQVVSFRQLYPRIFFPGTSEFDTSKLRLDAAAHSILTPLNPFTWLRAFRHIRAFSPDAIIFEWWQPFFGPLVGSLARWLRKPTVRCIIECHNVSPHERNPLDGLLLRFGLSAADYLITHSEKDREDLSVLFPEKKITVAPLPALDEFLGGHKSSRNGRTILFFGKIRKYKGLDVLLAALPSVLSKLDCKLLVVGEFYDSFEKYEQLIRRLQIQGNVHLENRYVPNEEVPAIFEKADVLVLPYVSASQSGVARIALSNGLPLIASRTGGLCETVIDNVNGLLFPPGDSEALASQLVRYFKDDLGPVFSENIRKTSAETSTRQLGDVIEELCRSSAHL